MWETYGKRLAHAMQLNGIEGRGAARRLSERIQEQLQCKLSEQSIGQYLKDPNRGPAAANSARLARVLRVDHYWLATGDGEPRPPGLTEDAQIFARQYDRLGDDGRKRFTAALVIAMPGVADKVVEEAMPITKGAREKAPQGS